jgi:hypothetical protein
MSSITGGFLADERTEAMAQLKTRLLAEGLRIEVPERELSAIAKPMLRVRSGSCGGLDVTLNDGTWVNAPVRESFSQASALRLRLCDEQIVIDDGATLHPVELVPRPAYYNQNTVAGVPMKRIGQLCSDRLGIGITNICTFYRSRAQRCQFCSIGSNTINEHANKADKEILETILAAVRDPVAPARHVLLGGGTPDRDDAGATRIARLTRSIKDRCDAPVYAMLAPPRDLAKLELLRDAGVDEIGMNIEVFSEEAARRFIPGKHKAIPLSHFWRALQRAVALFGPINTRSITVVGLEPASVTLAGVERLASIGVLPILSPLRPLEGTQLRDHPRLGSPQLWELTAAAAQAGEKHDMPLGPICIACQSNTLTVPGHPAYRLY